MRPRLSIKAMVAMQKPPITDNALLTTTLLLLLRIHAIPPKVRSCSNAQRYPYAILRAFCPCSSRQVHRRGGMCGRPRSLHLHLGHLYPAPMVGRPSRSAETSRKRQRRR